MIVIGNSSNPWNHIAPIAQRIKTISKIEFVFPELKDKRGNFIKCIGLINRKHTNDKSTIEVAKDFQDNGIKLLYLVDLNGAEKKSPKNLHALEMISEFTKLKINFTGGLYENEHVGQAFLRGADLVTISSIAVHNKELFMSWYLSWGRKCLCFVFL